MTFVTPEKLPVAEGKSPTTRDLHGVLVVWFGFDNRPRVIPLGGVSSSLVLHHNFVSMTEGRERTTVFAEIFECLNVALSKCIFF